MPARQVQTQKRTPSSGKRIIGSILLVMAVLALVIPMLAVAGTTLYVRQNQIIMPGVSVGPVDLSNLPMADAAIYIDNYWNNTTHFVVLNEQYKWTVTPPNIGLWIDPGLTAQEAYGVGRDLGGVDELMKLAVSEKVDLNPVVSFNEEFARGVFEDLAAKIVVPATDATLVQDAQGHWYTQAGTDGWGLDVETALATISADPQKVLEQGYLQLPMMAIPPAISDYSTELQQIATYYERPIHLRAYDAITDELLTWDLPQEMVASWVHLDDPYGQPYLTVDEGQFKNYLKDWETTIGNREIESKEPVDTLAGIWGTDGVYTIMLRHKPTEYTVKYGENLISIAFKVGMPYWKIQDANPGTSIYSVYAGQVLTIPSKNEMFPYPVVFGKRIVISISEQHMWIYENFELIADHVISTGMANSPTLPGVFQIQSHEINAYASNWDLWMPNFMGIYEAVPGFMNGIHGLPVLSSGVRLWANVLGHPASYGCIILDLQAGEDVYNWAENGVVVEIQP